MSWNFIRILALACLILAPHATGQADDNGERILEDPESIPKDLEESIPEEPEPITDDPEDPDVDHPMVDDGDVESSSDDVALEAVGINTEERNVTAEITENTNATAEAPKPRRANCLPVTEGSDSMVVLNATAFLQTISDQFDANVTNRTMPAPCMLTMFFAPWCPFSVGAAPHFHALARVFPDLQYSAVDSSRFHSINTQFGIVALPTVLFFHNSKLISKFNHTEFELPEFAEFVTRVTGMEPVSTDFNITDADWEGPLPIEVVPEPDYYLHLAWLFTIVVAVFYFGKSSVCSGIVDAVRNTWREAEIQHEHRD